MRRKPSTHPCLLVCLLVISGIPAAETGARAHQSSPSPSDQPTIVVPLNFPEATYEDTGDYISVEVEGAQGYIRQSGAPLLPFWSTMISLPVGTGVRSIAISGALYKDYIINRRIAPAPEPASAVPGALPPPLFEGPAYETPSLFPSGELEHSLTTGSGPSGVEAHLFVRVFPLRWNPVTGHVVQLLSGDLEIRYAPPSFRTGQRSGNESYELLAICPDEFEAEMGRYTEHKSAQGLSCRLVNLSSVYNNSIFNVSSGRDNQERIKLFIMQALESWGVRYVALAGDVDKLPIRRAYINDIDGTATPTDLYYGDVYKGGGLNFSDWDYDRDGLYGESSSSSANADRVDLDPDVSVGRLPAGSVAELRAMINKTIAYAETVAPDGGFFRNVTLVGTDTFGPSRGENSGVAEGEYACDKAAEYIPLFNFSRFYEKAGTFKTANITAALGAGCGLALFSDHGSVGGVCYPDSGGGPGLSSSTAQTLKNGPRLPLSILDACLTHALDSSECLGEYLVLNPQGGSVASIGLTRIGYGSFGTYHVRWNSGFMLVHLVESFSRGTVMPAVMLDETKRSYLNNVGIWDYADFKTLVEYILLGDPVVLLGGLGMEATPDSAAVWADPGESATFKVEVRNRALHAEELALSASCGDWACGLDTEALKLKASSSANVSLRVEVPPGALAYQEGRASLVVVPKSTGLPIELETTVVVNCVRKLELKVERSAFEALPGGALCLNYTIINGGNIAELVDLRLRGGQNGWMVDLNKSGIDVQPRSQTDGAIELDVPGRTISGGYGFTLMMASRSGLVDQATVFVEIMRTHGLELSAPSTHQSAGARGASFLINLTNLGNHFETFELSAQNLPDGWSALHPSRVSLDAFEGEGFQLSVFPAKRALAGDYNISLSARGLEGQCCATLELSAAVEPVSSLTLSCPEPHLSVSQGSDITYVLALDSGSNIEERVALGVEGMPGGWEWFLGTEDAPLPPFTARRVNITVRVPQPCAAGLYRFALVASTEGWSAEQNVTAEVVPSRSFTLSVDRTQERLAPGSSTYLNITIKNTGNCPDTYILSLEDGAVAQFSRNYIRAAAGSEALVGLTVQVPEDAPSGDRTILVTAASSLDPSLTRSVSIRVRIDRVSRISLEFEGASSVEAGARGQFSIIIKNMGPEEETVSLAPLSRPAWELELESASVPPGSVREARVVFIVPEGVPSGIFNISLVASSELQSWTIVHSVSVIGAPSDGGAPVPGEVSATSSALLPALTAAVLVVCLVVGLIVIGLLSRRKG
ncbi:MAG: C25 family cysteine peptidase [Thermoplasmatota archaeon]